MAVGKHGLLVHVAFLSDREMKGPFLQGAKVMIPCKGDTQA
jgi:hypothetical protein